MGWNWIKPEKSTRKARKSTLSTKIHVKNVFACAGGMFFKSFRGEVTPAGMKMLRAGFGPRCSLKIEMCDK
jgi:hypothetical protein